METERWEVPEGKPKIDEILKIYKRDTRACLCTLYTLVKKEKLMVLEKAGIFQGAKSLKLRIQVGLFDRKGYFLRNNKKEEKEYGAEASVFSDLADIWLLFS